MYLLVVRHAIAEDRDEYAATGADDDDRPLTATGKRRMRRNAEGLRRIATHIERLAASPLVRAQQTARILADAFSLRDMETLEALRPDAHPRALLTWLGKHEADATVAVVGHEPYVGALISWCVAGSVTAHIPLKKGGGALIAFDRKPVAGRGALRWLLTPGQLRALAR